MLLDVEFNSAAQVSSDIYLEAARWADEAGFAGLWKGESNNRDPFVLLSAAAAVTERLELGTAVCNIYARSPITAAIQSTVLNELSQGRFIFGLGAGNDIIAAWHGDNGSRPLARLKEYVAIYKTAAAAERVPDRLGRFYRSSAGFRLAFDPSYPSRLFLGALGPHMARLAGQVADGFITNMATPDIMSSLIEAFREGAESVGRYASREGVVNKLRVAINRDVSQAKDVLKGLIVFYSIQTGYDGLFSRSGWEEQVNQIKEAVASAGFRRAREEASHLVPDAMLESLPFYAGRDLDRLPERLSEFRRRGCGRLVLAYVFSGQDLRREIKDFVRMAREVIEHEGSPGGKS